ncbi:MAG TPA: hypothetical protein VFJ93_07955 [Gaiellaceae bacterium]|nr:hypothetical protein [Gaiellaceae bacterium]
MMIIRHLPIVTIAASLFGLSYAQQTATPRVVTLRDSGKTLTVRKGAELQLHLTERYRWLSPRVRGSAVRLTRIEFIRDPGYRAWSIAARARGTAVVTATGYGESAGRRCDPGPCAPHLFRVTFAVR